LLRSNFCLAMVLSAAPYLFCEPQLLALAISWLAMLLGTSA
jgi:hypothetical protein